MRKHKWSYQTVVDRRRHGLPPRNPCGPPRGRGGEHGGGGGAIEAMDGGHHGRRQNDDLDMDCQIAMTIGDFKGGELLIMGA